MVCHLFLTKTSWLDFGGHDSSHWHWWFWFCSAAQGIVLPIFSKKVMNGQLRFRFGLQLGQKRTQLLGELYGR